MENSVKNKLKETRRLQQAQTDILKLFVNICEKPFNWL